MKPLTNGCDESGESCVFIKIAMIKRMNRYLSALALDYFVFRMTFLAGRFCASGNDWAVLVNTTEDHLGREHRNIPACR